MFLFRANGMANDMSLLIPPKALIFGSHF